MGRRKRGVTKTKSSDESDGVSPTKSMEVLDSDSKENIPDEVVIVTQGAAKKGRKRVKSASQLNSNSTDDSSRTVTTEIVDEKSRRGTYVLSKTPNKVLKDVSSGTNTKEITSRKLRKNRAESNIEDRSEGVDEIEISDDKKPKNRARSRRNKSLEEERIIINKEENTSPEFSKKTTRKPRNKSQQKSDTENDSNDITDRRGTFVVSKTLVPEVKTKLNRHERNQNIEEELSPQSDDGLLSTHINGRIQTDSLLHQENQQVLKTAVQNNNLTKKNKSSRQKRNKSIEEESLPASGVELVTFVSLQSDEVDIVKTKSTRQKRNRSVEHVQPESILVDPESPISNHNHLVNKSTEKNEEEGIQNKNLILEVSEQVKNTEIKNRRGTFVISKTPSKKNEDIRNTEKKNQRSRRQSIIQEQINSIILQEPKSNDKKTKGRAKTNKSSEQVNSDLQEKDVSLSQKSTRRPRSNNQQKQLSLEEEAKDIEMRNNEKDNVKEDIPETKQGSGKKRGRAKKTNSINKNYETDQQSTTFEESTTVQQSIDSPNKNTERNSLGVTSINQSKNQENLNETAVDCESVSNHLPVGQVPCGSRRGTFSVSRVDKETIDTERSITTSSILKTNENKRKRSGSVPDLSKNSTLSSLKEKSKKVKVASVSGFNKTVNFITPDSSRKWTPKKSNISLTPHPVKRSASISTPLFKKKSLSTPELNKSLSTPLSVKRTPGQFSARKMPNFSKIHKKQFEKMESLVKYVEKKQIKKNNFSSLNKTFTGLSSQDEMKKSKRSGSASPSGRKAAKSLIPVRTGVKFSDKESIKSFANKTRTCQMESIREKERAIIKGVRANKRFLLQMKMRKLAT